MTEKQKQELTAGGILAVILLLLAWVFYSMFGGKVGSLAAPGAGVGGTTLGGSPVSIGGSTGGTFNYQPYMGVPGGSGCCCEGSDSGCPQTTSGSLGTINQMIAAANAAAAQIAANGNATLEAIAAYANANDPLLNVTVG